MKRLILLFTLLPILSFGQLPYNSEYGIVFYKIEKQFESKECIAELINKLGLASTNAHEYIFKLNNQPQKILSKKSEGYYDFENYHMGGFSCEKRTEMGPTSILIPAKCTGNLLSSCDDFRLYEIFGFGKKVRLFHQNFSFQPELQIVDNNKLIIRIKGVNVGVAGFIGMEMIMETKSLGEMYQQKLNDKTGLVSENIFIEFDKILRDLINLWFKSIEDEIKKQRINSALD
jgi:hypothetical protein